MDNFALQGLITQSRLLLKCDCRVPVSRHGNSLHSVRLSPLWMAGSPSRHEVTTVDAVLWLFLFSFPCLGLGISPHFMLRIKSFFTHQKWLCRVWFNKEEDRAQSSAPWLSLAILTGWWGCVSHRHTAACLCSSFPCILGLKRWLWPLWPEVPAAMWNDAKAPKPNLQMKVLERLFYKCSTGWIYFQP